LHKKGLVDEQIGKVQIHKEYKKKEQACRCTVVFAFVFWNIGCGQFHEQAYEQGKRSGMVYMAPYGDTHYYIRFLNEDIYINVKYIKEDIKN